MKFGFQILIFVLKGMLHLQKALYLPYFRENLQKKGEKGTPEASFLYDSATVRQLNL
jgi:hypothetical protein